MVLALTDSVLREKAVVVSEPLEKGLFKAMVSFMHERGGMGLAAPQVGIPLRVFVTDVPRDKPRVFINPEIVERSTNIERRMEGCLSVPGAPRDVDRPERIKIRARDLKGRPFSLECGGLLARCIQHEYDHLDGILIDSLTIPENGV